MAAAKIGKTSKPVQAPAKTGVAVLDDLFASVNRSDAPGLAVRVALQGKTVLPTLRQLMNHTSGYRCLNRWLRASDPWATQR